MTSLPPRSFLGKRRSDDVCRYHLAMPTTCEIDLAAQWHEHVVDHHPLTVVVNASQVDCVNAIIDNLLSEERFAEMPRPIIVMDDNQEHPFVHCASCAMRMMCRKSVMGKTWPHSKTCIRPRGHLGRCRPIEQGMTAREADAISRGE